MRWVKNKSLNWGRGWKGVVRDGKASTEKLKDLSAPGCIWRCWGFMTPHMPPTEEDRIYVNLK